MTAKVLSFTHFMVARELKAVEVTPDMKGCQCDVCKGLRARMAEDQARWASGIVTNALGVIHVGGQILCTLPLKDNQRRFIVQMIAEAEQRHTHFTMTRKQLDWFRSLESRLGEAVKEG